MYASTHSVEVDQGKECLPHGGVCMRAHTQSRLTRGKSASAVKFDNMEEDGVCVCVCVYLLVCPSVVQCIFLKFSGELEPHSVEVDQGKSAWWQKGT